MKRLALLTFSLALVGAAPPPKTTPLGGMGWAAAPAPGVFLRVSPAAGDAVRLDFDFGGKAGWGAAPRKGDPALPERWEIRMRLRGEALPNDLELKLADPSGENVWWFRKRNATFPAAFEPLRVKQRQVEFAWGPAGGGAPSRIGSIEVTVTAGKGGKGWLEVADLVLLELPPEPPAGPPSQTASSSAPGHGAALAADGDPSTSWRAAKAGPAEWRVDLGALRELGGLVVEHGASFASRYVVDLSEDGATWRAAREVAGGNGGRDLLALPESEARAIRLRLLEGPSSEPFELKEVSVKPLAFAATPNAFLAEVAKEGPRGSWPRYLAGEQSYWTVVGVDGDPDEGLLSEDGALEAGAGLFSIEPFLVAGGRLLTWADVTSRPALADGDLPIPSVTWDAGETRLETTALATGLPGASALLARYRVANLTKGERRVRLVLAIRPLQVNPPWQFLGTPGGASEIRSLAFEGARASVNGERVVAALVPPSAAGARTLDAGDVSDLLRAGSFPPASAVSDPTGFASGAFAFDLLVPGGGSREVVLAVPFERSRAPAELARPLGTETWLGFSPAEASALFESLLTRERSAWRSRLDRVAFDVPPEAERWVKVLRSQLAFVLVNRDGPAIQPGSRSYARSWIRDGSLTSEALLRLGQGGVARSFLLWFSGYQGEDGRVPCCVDARGADGVPENDSHGQLLFLIAETVRYTRDRGLAARMWPHVVSAVSFLDALRQKRRTPEYETEGKRVFYGLLPESISHEGYSAKPMHSYWDGFFGLRGLKDAVFLAEFLGKADEARAFATIRDEFAADLHASIRLVMERHGIDYLPGCAELGDFDATSTTAALSPGGEEARLPRAALVRTFERYLENLAKREAGEGDSYTPYEWRNVGARARLGRREKALRVAGTLLRDLRPAEWNQWGEVVWRDPRTPKFIGDMPHTWVGSDFARSFLDLFAYEREEDSSLVVGAGLPERWVRSERGVSVKGLGTPYGPLDVSLAAAGTGVRVRLAGLRALPPGGLVVRPPLPAIQRTASVDGRPLPLSPAGEVVVRTLPAEVVVRP
ncbi:MAG TPA: discoidin domain-containing protein [Thermoanaerobaculia bacterium]|nr:discoidin domain-containing protein [Thermoanaerobaculia bacterium]